MGGDIGETMDSPDKAWDESSITKIRTGVRVIQIKDIREISCSRSQANVAEIHAAGSMYIYAIFTSSTQRNDFIRRMLDPVS
jgi:hypothetical protein